MTEKEKMLAGQNYDSRDSKLLLRYHEARKLMQSYNTLDSKAIAKREELLNSLFGFKGNAVWIEAPFFCDYGEHISIGKNTFVNANCFFLDNNKITIGKNGLIGPYVQIYTASHPLKASERIVKIEGATRYLTNSKSVSIGDNVWIGGNTVIMPGVKIGNNVTIGAGSVVTKNIPNDVLAAGNPCEIQKTIN